jgi:hypothetical protein
VHAYYRVHANYRPWNLLVQSGAACSAIGAAVDGEFTLAGPALCDLVVFVCCNERMPAEYTTGFLAGYGAASGSAPLDTRTGVVK